jgi:hypothetical protein
MLPSRTHKRPIFNYLRKCYQFIAILASILIPFTVFCHFLAFPRNPVYLASLVPEENNSVFLIAGLINGIFYFCTLMGVMFRLIFILSILVNFALSLYPLISCELRSNRNSYRTMSCLRTPHILIPFYRNLEVMVKLFNEIIRPSIIPMQAMITQFTLFSVYTLMVGWSKADMEFVVKVILLLGIVAAVGCWSFLLQFGGWFSENSSKTLNSWKFFKLKKQEKKYLSKFRKSCRPLCIRVDEEYGQCRIGRLSVLKFLKGIIRGIFRALLTLHKRK